MLHFTILDSGTNIIEHQFIHNSLTEGIEFAEGYLHEQKKYVIIVSDDHGIVHNEIYEG